MSLRDDLLAPIAGTNPGGIELRYDPVFDKIKEARREDLDAPQGEWTTTLKTADWPLVIKLAKDAIATKSKDLQIAAWLAEALARREGFPGLRSGVEVLSGLVDAHWDHLYPEIDDGDAEMRAAPLEWVGTKLDLPVRRIAIDKSGNDFLQYKESRTVPTEEAANESTEKRTARDDAIANGRSTPEMLDAGFTATPKVWFKTLVADIEATIDAVQALDAVSRQKFGDIAPSFGRLVDTLEDCLRSANAQYKRKLEIEPDPVEEMDSPSAVGEAGGALSSPSGAASGGTPGSLSAEPTSREDATSRIVVAARYLRQADPYNPSSYLLLRGFRWGELRAGGATVDPKLLEAPATNVRTNLKGLLLDSRWPELLAACELVMGTPQGRGWIDLQRYALTACDALGSDYFPVATAIRAALRGLLADLPHLLDMTLMDDTPTSNVETRAWLRATVLQEGDVSDGADHGGDAAENGDGRGRDPLSLASAEVRGGRPDRAIALLMREAGRAKTSRARFLLQAELARTMVDAGHEGVAMPILEQLIAAVEEHKLEDWEDGVVVAAPMALLYRVLEKTEGDAETRQSLYLRICRLDPIQAISFAQP